MSQFSNACLIAGLAIAGGAAAQTAPNDDPHAWLEDVQGEKALDWVKARNARAEAEIAGTPAFKTLEAQIRAILDSDAKIPGVQKIGDYYYNFWKDKQHERGYANVRHVGSGMSGWAARGWPMVAPASSGPLGSGS